MDLTPEASEQPIPLSRGLEIRRAKEERNRNLAPSPQFISDQNLRQILEESVTTKVLDKVSRLETTINRVLEHIQEVQLGEAENSALRVTTDASASDIALAHVSLHPDDYYKHTTTQLAEQLNIKIYDMKKMIRQSEIKQNPRFHREVITGKKSHCHKYSDEALNYLKDYLRNGSYIVPDSRKI